MVASASTIHLMVSKRWRMTCTPCLEFDVRLDLLELPRKRCRGWLQVQMVAARNGVLTLPYDEIAECPGVMG
jgi:hypothetical protein